MSIILQYYIIITNITSKLSSHINLTTHAGHAFDNHVNFTFDFLTLGIKHAEQLPRTVCLPSLALIAQVIFLLEHGHTQIHKVTDATDHPTRASANACGGKNTQREH